MNTVEVSQWIVKGGPIMWPIIAGSVAGLAIVLQKTVLLMILKRRNKENDFPERVFGLLREKDDKKALEFCSGVDSPFARILQKGLETGSSGKVTAEMAMEREGAKQMKRLEWGMGLLLSIVGLEPMMGFLGTIIGLIQAFKTWEELGNSVTVSALSGGMYSAMITTAAGLAVAIPLYLCYNSLMSAFKGIAHEWNEAGTTVADYFKKGKE
ncbi:MAG: MotA/TolQ/ExbB proton channel family protein [Elusimicrobiota bacterium]